MNRRRRRRRFRFDLRKWLESFGRPEAFAC